MNQFEHSGDRHNHYDQTKETWNKLADAYMNMFLDLRIYDSVYDAFMNCIQVKNARVLELGCGPANISRYLKSKNPSWIIHATDVAPAMVELAQKLNPTIQTSCLDIRNMHRLEGRFDAIVAGFVIPYLLPEDCRQFIQSLSAKLTPNGVVFVSFVPGEPSLSGIKKGSSGDAMHFQFYSVEQMLHYFENWQIIHEFETPFSRNDGSHEIHYTIIARVPSS